MLGGVCNRLGSDWICVFSYYPDVITEGDSIDYRGFTVGGAATGAWRGIGDKREDTLDGL